MEFLMVSQVLGLQEDFSHLNIYPNHLCGQCKQTVNSYKAFKEEALKNETFVVKYQESIYSIGLGKAKDLFDTTFESDFIKENKSEDLREAKTEELSHCDDDERKDADFIKEEEMDISSDMFGFVGDNSESEEEEESEKDDDEKDEDWNIEDNEENAAGDDDKDEAWKIEGNEEDALGSVADRTCQICQKVFISSKTKFIHEKNTHSSALPCPVCGKAVKYLREHYKKNHPEKLPKSLNGICVLCNKEYSQGLKEHEMANHDHVGVIECPICNKVFHKTASGTVKNLKSTVKAHINYTHNGYKPLSQPCPICGKMSTNVKVHMQRSHSTDQVKCTYADCKKVFNTKIKMEYHIKRKHLTVPTVCTKCGDSFKAIKEHQYKCFATEEQVKERSCLICDKVFSSKSSKTLHMKSKHGPGEPEVPCPICGKCVKGLSNHIKVVHTEEGKQAGKKFKCDFEGCEQRFRSGAVMRRHYTCAHTDEKEQCGECGQWLKNLYGHMMTVHKMGKKMPCPECDKIFYKSHDLKMHRERIHEGMRYICPECGVHSSKIREHMRSAHSISDVDLARVATVRTK